MLEAAVKGFHKGVIIILVAYIKQILLKPQEHGDCQPVTVLQMSVNVIYVIRKVFQQHFCAALFITLNSLHKYRRQIL